MDRRIRKLLILTGLLFLVVTGTFLYELLAKGSGKTGIARSTISNLASQLNRYAKDTGKYPGEGSPEAENAFPALFDALFAEGRTMTGGPNASKNHVLDPWGRPYIYRWFKKGSGPPSLYGREYVIYSTGLDGIDQTMSGEGGDDITNWNLTQPSGGAFLVFAIALAVSILIFGLAVFRGLRSPFPRR